MPSRAGSARSIVSSSIREGDPDDGPAARRGGRGGAIALIATAPAIATRRVEKRAADLGGGGRWGR